MSELAKISCAKVVPKNSVQGTPNYCYKSGMRSGFKAGIEKGQLEGKTKLKTQSEQHKKNIEKEKTKSTIEKMLVKRLTHKEIGEMINSRGLRYMKDHLHLDSMNKDEVRSIAVRYTGTTHMINGYSKMNLEELKNALLQRGFKR
jgi:hypothetical protein